MPTAKSVKDLIGQTPILDITSLYPAEGSRVMAKLECANPMSIKDRAVLSMITAAQSRGEIGSQTEVVDKGPIPTRHSSNQTDSSSSSPSRSLLSEMRFCP